VLFWRGFAHEKLKNYRAAKEGIEIEEKRREEKRREEKRREEKGREGKGREENIREDKIREGKETKKERKRGTKASLSSHLSFFSFPCLDFSSCISKTNLGEAHFHHAYVCAKLAAETDDGLEHLRAIKGFDKVQRSRERQKQRH
jgi:hypothetical protein